MPTIEERLKQLASVNDADLMMGYRFLVTRRRRRTAVKRSAAKRLASKNTGRSVAKHKSAGKTAGN
jgi:hypothetical protein